jgi:hypothetical protein
MFDPVAEGFLWPTPQTLSNVRDETLDIEPMGFASSAKPYDQLDEGEKMALRLYQTNLGDMSEIEVMHWVCGGGAEWMDALTKFREIVGLDRPTRVGNIYQRMARYGVSQEVCELTILRLVRGQYAKLDGIGDNALFTLMK